MNAHNPYDALRRVLALRAPAQRSLLRLVVFCEASKHSPIRVFQLREGLLVQCRSDADVRDMKDSSPHLPDWSRRRAFFLDEWLDQPAETRAESHLQVVCDCAQTTPRLVDVQRLADAIPETATRRVTLPAVAAAVR